MVNELVQASDLTKNSKYFVSSEESKEKKKFNILSLLTGKNLKIIILCIILIIALVLFISVSDNSNNNSENSTSEKEYKYQTTMEYCNEIETKLEALLSQIEGAGQVKVMVTVDGSPELVYASDTDTKTSSTSNGSTTTTSSSPIIVNTNGSSNALILTENLPSVKGVIVVSSGANQVSIRLDILNAVSTLLDISTDKISVLKGI